MVVIALVLVALTGAALSVRILKQYERAVVFRLGRVQGGARGPGLIAIVPLVDRVHRVSLRIVTTRCTPGSRPNYGRVLGSMGPTRSRPANVIDPLGLFGVGRLGHHIGLPSLEDASDTAAGFGDGAFGLTRKIRQALDVDNVNRCSAAYAGGNIVGTIAAGSWGLASRCSAMASTPGSPSRNGERGRAQVGSRSNCTSEPKRPFYVVDGELALWLDGDALVRGPGSYVLVRAGWAHTFLGPA